MFIAAKKLKTTSILINRRMDRLWCVYTIAHCTTGKIDETEPPVSIKIKPQRSRPSAWY